MVVAIPLLAVLWCAAIVTAPLLPPLVSAAVYAAGSVVCHQIPERSFHLGTSQLAVCARCLGIYAGGAAGAVAAAVSWRQPEGLLTSKSNLVRSVVGLATLPTVITVTLEVLGMWSTTNETRALAGLPLGIATSFVATAFAKLHYKSCVPRRRTAPSPPPPPI